MLKCADPSVGRLLHSYELKLLSEEETELFELHLLSCDYCLKRLTTLARKIEMLTSADEVATLTRDIPEHEPGGKVLFLTMLWRRIWPETPLVFKPALAYLLVLLLIVPAYYGFVNLGEKEPIGIQIAELAISERAIGDNIFRIESGLEVIMRFPLGDSVLSDFYRVAIQSTNGDFVLEIPDFNQIDDDGRGLLKLPVLRMKPGNYKLIITDPRTGSAREHYFRIEK